MSDQVWARLKLLVAQGKATLISDAKVQAVVLEGEPLNNIKRIEPYGYSYRPKAGSQVYLAFPNGDRALGLALIIGDKRYQMTLEEGEVAIHDDEENWVHIKRGGTIEVKAATKVIATTPLFETTEDAKIGGNLLVMGTTTSNGGYYGTGGGVAQMHGGAYVFGEFKVNDVDCSDGHKHITEAIGAPTSDVIG